MSKKTKDYINAGNFNEYKIETIDLEKVIKDNGTLDSDTTLNTRKSIWGNSYSDYRFNEEIYDNDITHPIRIVKRNGKYLVEDGNHRLVALKNNGYEQIEVLVRKENK